MKTHEKSMLGHLKGGEALLLKPWGMLGIYRHVNNNVCFQSSEQSSNTSDVHLLTLFTC